MGEKPTAGGLTALIMQTYTVFKGSTPHVRGAIPIRGLDKVSLPPLVIVATVRPCSELGVLGAQGGVF